MDTVTELERRASSLSLRPGITFRTDPRTGEWIAVERGTNRVLARHDSLGGVVLMMDEKESKK